MAVGNDSKYGEIFKNETKVFVDRYERVEGALADRIKKLNCKRQSEIVTERNTSSRES